MVKTELVDTDNLLSAGVDSCLLACSSLLDSEFRNTCLDSLSHTAKFLNLLDMTPSLMSQLVGKRLYVV